MATPSTSKARASSVARTAPSMEFSNGTRARSTSPAATAWIAPKIVAFGTSSTSAPPAARSASSLNVPAGPRNPTFIRSRSASALRVPGGLERRLASLAARHRLADRLAFLRREVQLGLAADDPLGEEPRLVAMKDRREDDPSRRVVEERDRARLAPGHLVVGVVADHRGVRDRARQAPLRLLEALLQRGRRLRELARLGLDLALHSCCVRHHVTCLHAEHSDLLRPD